MAKIKKSKLDNIAHYNEYKNRQSGIKDEKKEESAAKAASPSGTTGTTANSSGGSQQRSAKIKQSKLDSITGYSAYRARVPKNATPVTDNSKPNGGYTLDEIRKNLNDSYTALTGSETEVNNYLRNYGATHEDLSDKLAEKYGAKRDADGNYMFYDEKAYSDYQNEVAAIGKLYDSYNAGVNEYNKWYDLAENYKSDASGAEIAGDAFWAGLAQADHGLTSTLSFLESAVTKPLGDLLGNDDLYKEGLFYNINEYYAGLDDQFSQQLADDIAGKGKATQIAAELGTATVAAIPQAVLALMSGGTSTAAQGAALTGAASTSLASTIGTAATLMAKNPLYWSSVMTTMGPAYDEAKANGASELQASAVALISSALNSGVEVSGGIEVLPARLRAGDTNAIIQWVLSAPEEGIEEVVQRLVSGSTDKILYDHDKPIYSATDETAIINPIEMGKEFMMGTGVALGLGGVQTGAVTAANAMNNQRYGKVGSGYQTAAEEVIAEGLTFSENSEAHKLATELKAKQESGGTITDAELGKQVVANERAVAQEEHLAEANRDPQETLEQLARETVEEQQKTAQSEAVWRESTAKRTPVPYNAMSVENPVRQSVMQAKRDLKKLTGYGEEGQKLFTEIMDQGGVTASELMARFDTPYQAGLTGLPMKQANLIDNFQVEAYNAGRMDLIARDAKDAEHKPGAILSEEESGFDFTGAPKDLTQEQKDFAVFFSKAMGVAGKFDGKNGKADYNALFNRKTGSVAFAQDFGIDPRLMKKLGSMDYMKKVEALAEKRGHSFIFYVAHEIADHAAADRAPKQMRAFNNAMLNYLQSNTADENLIRSKQMFYASHKVDLDVHGATEEVGADSILMLYDGDEQKFMDAMRRIFNSTDEQAKEGARIYKNKLDEIISKLKAWWRKLTGKENAEARVNVEKSISELEQLRSMFEEAIAESMRTVKDARAKGVDSTVKQTNDSIVQLSLKNEDAYNQAISAGNLQTAQQIAVRVAKEKGLDPRGVFTQDKTGSIIPLHIATSPEFVEFNVKYSIKYEEGNRKPDLTLVGEKGKERVAFMGDRPADYVPKKIGYAYKLMEQYPDGTLHALFAGTGKGFTLGEWNWAEGFEYDKDTDFDMKGLRPRFGWHMGTGAPSTHHLMGVGDTLDPKMGYYSKVKGKGRKRVWVRVAYDATNDYSTLADQTQSGDIYGMIPFGGYYMFQEGNLSLWILSSAIKFDHILTEEERQQILAEQGINEEEMWQKRVLAPKLKAEETRLTNLIAKGKNVEKNQTSLDRIHQLMEENPYQKWSDTNKRKKQTDAERQAGRRKIADSIVDNPDLQYSMKDSTGADITREQAEYFKDSQIRDEEGNLRRVYHGTNTGDFTVFDWNQTQRADGGWFGRGFYFAFYKGEAQMYGRRVIDAYLDIKNPFVFDEQMKGFDGQEAENVMAENLAFMINFAEKFPELAKDRTMTAVTGWDDQGYGTVKSIPWSDLRGEIEKILNDQTFKVTEISDPYEGDYFTFLMKDGPGKYDYAYSHVRYKTKEDAEAHRFDAAVEMLSRVVYKHIETHMPHEYIMDIGSEFTEALKKRGYDGVLQTRRGDEIVAFYPEQIKSADNKRPTSNPDINYSLKDSEGRELSKQQQEYFKDSKVRDDQGRLVTVYHSSPTAGFTVFNGEQGNGNYRFSEYGTGITFFTDNKEMAASYGDGEGSQYEGYLNITKPYVVDAKGRAWDSVSSEFSQELYDQMRTAFTAKEKAALISLAGWEDFSAFNEEVSRAVRDSGKPTADENTKVLNSAFWKCADMAALFNMASENFSDDVIRRNSYMDLTTNQIVEKALQDGSYDGVIIKNVIDYGFEGFHTSMTPTGTDYIIFNSNQFKSQDNKNPTEDPDIRYSIKSTAHAAGLDVGRDDTGKIVFKMNGKVVTSVTADHIKNNSGLGALITVAADKGNITGAEAKKQYEAMAEIMNMIMRTQDPDLVWAWVGSSMFSALKSNADGQYGTTIDFTTVCRKTQDIITAMSRAMMQLKRGLTKDEVTRLQAELIGVGSSVPCPVCYVFSRWAGIGSILDNMYRWQEKYDGYTDEQLSKRVDELTEKLGKGKAKDLKKMLREQDEEYDSLDHESEMLSLEKKQLTAKRKKAVRDNDAYTLRAVDDRLNEVVKRIAQVKKRMNEIKSSVAPELAWLLQVRTDPNYAKHGKVKADVLFNLDDAATFAESYPLAWKYRTSRGPSAGKAILPYSDMRLGDMILGVDSNSATGNDLFANTTGKFNEQQMAALDKAIKRTKAQNLIGGQRFQSTSDFRYDYALDYLMAFFEAQALGSKMQTYTKIIEFADMVAAVRGDVNLSVMPKNKGFITTKDGVNRLVFSSVTGIDFEAAKRANELHDNAQLILVGINDEHILAALEDSEETLGKHIGFVIPYHASGASINEFIRVLVSNLGESFTLKYYQDYSDVQSDKERGNATAAQKRRNDLRSKLLKGKEGGKNWEPSAEDLAFIRGKSVDISGRSFADLRSIERKALSGNKAAIAEYESWTAGALWDLYNKMWVEGGAEYGVRLNTNQAKAVMPHEYWNKTVNRDKAYINGFLFRSYCYNLGLTPRFTGATVKGEKHGDFTDSKGYWKTLIDRPMYNNDGTYRDQQTVNVSSFQKEMLTADYAKKNWAGYSVQEPDVVRAGRAADRFIEKTQNGQYSLKGEQAMRDEIARIRREGAKAGKSAAEIETEVAGVVGPEYAELLKTYGEIESGERPYREIKVPKKSDKKRKVSQTVRTILEAGVTPETAIPTIQEMVASGDFSYNVYTDKAAIKIAEDTIKSKGYGTALADWIKAVEGGNVSKTNTAIGWALYNQAATSGDLTTAMTVLNHIVGHQRSAAQAVQATRILKKLEPDAQLYGVVQSVQRLEESISKNKKTDPVQAAQAAETVGKAKKDAADAAKKAPSGVKVKRGGKRVVVEGNQAGEPFVFEYAQKVGESLARGLEAKRNSKPKQKTFLQQIVAELNRFASEKLPKEKKGKPLTAVDLLRDYIQNQSFYAEAWQAAQQELRRMYKDDEFLGEFVNSGIGVDANTNPQNAIFMRALVMAAADSGEGKAMLKKQEALGFTGMADTIADDLIRKTGAEGEMADTIRDAAYAYVQDSLRDTDADDTKFIESAIRSAMKDIGLKMSDVVMSGTGESAKQAIVSKLVAKYGFGRAEASNTADIVFEQFDKMSRKYAENRLKSMFAGRKNVQRTIPEKIERLARLGAFDAGSQYNEQAAKRIFQYDVPLTVDEDLAREFLLAKTQDERDEILKKIYMDIGRQMPSTFMDKWNAWRYLAMLGNVRTHVRNVVGNAGFAPVVMTKNLAATFIEGFVDFVAPGKMGRTKSTVSGELLKAAWADYANADDATAGGKYNDAAIKNKYINDGRSIFRFKPLEAARKFNSAALSKEDMWFSRPHYAFALAQYCKANKIPAEQIRSGKGLDAAREYAMREAKKATYQDSNMFSEAVGKMGRYHGDNKVLKGASVVLEGIMPFRKTPANILVRGLEYSPMGFVNGIKQALWDVRKGTKTGAEAIDSIAAGFTGTMLLGLGVYLAAEGLIRGAGGDDDKEKKFEELQGHQTYALELPDGKSITLDWLAPEALPLFIGVNLYETASKNKGMTTLADILSAVSNVTEPMLEMSCLQSLSDIFDSVEYASSNELNPFVSALSSAATSYLTQAFPTIMGQAERSAQDVRMTTYTEKNGFLTSDMQYTLGKVSAKLPGWDFNQIPYVDAWGRTESTGDPLDNAINNFLNPAYTSQIETSAMEEELQRLYEATGKGGVLPSRADKKITVNKEDKHLTAEEYVEYATEKGQLSYNLLEDLTSRKEYKNMDDSEKAEAVGLAYEYANAIAKTKVSDYEPGGWVATALKAAEDCGMGEMEYILYKMALSMADEANTKGVKDSYDSTEKAAAIEAMSNLSDKEIAFLWGSEAAQKAYNAGLDMNNYVQRLANGETVNVDKVADAMNNGISEQTYYDFLAKLKEVDTPTKSGKMGSYTQDEARAAIAAMHGLTRAQRAYLWQSVGSNWSAKNNPWR